jgi:hypothetical protein
MSTAQTNDPAAVIRWKGEPVALVIDGQAFLNLHLDEADALTVKGMCLFALEVQAGTIDGPYSDERALAYAREADRQRVAGRHGAER